MAKWRPWGSNKPVQPEVVTLCGSMRFLGRMLDVAARETVAGRIVLAPFAVIPVDDQDGTVKRELDELHRRKIDLSDRVIVVSDHTGYYGESTRGEIAYARRRGIPVELPTPPAVPVPRWGDTGVPWDLSAQPWDDDSTAAWGGSRW